MKILCYVSDDAVFHSIETALKYVQADYERIVSKVSMLSALKRYDHDMILVEIDAELSNLDGTLSWLGSSPCDNVPVVLLSAIRNAHVIAAAIDAGATDFICLPFQPMELAARLSAVLRRNNAQRIRHSIELGGFFLDQETGELLDHGNAVELTRREFAMAWLLFSTPGAYISREKIGNSIWHTSSEIAGRTIEQHIYKLRKKLNLCAERGVIIRTAYTHGYRLELLQRSTRDAYSREDERTFRRNAAVAQHLALSA